MLNIKNNKGITLIALIITIIVMLILVAVTINIAVNGGLFGKAKAATIQTEIAQIQEQLVLKKADIIAENKGNIPSSGYGISLISSLDLPKSIKDKYGSKLTISSDGTLYYLENAVTNEEKGYFEAAGITAYPGETPETDSEPTTPTYPLSGKTFKCALYPTMDTFDIVFSDTTFTWYNETGTYDYNPTTHTITGSITLNSTPTAINTTLYTSGNNEYFVFDAMGASLPMTLSVTSESILPFNGTYTNSSTSYVFSKDSNNYGKIECSGVIPSTNYCYFEETETLYYGDMRTLGCTHNQDYTEITMNNVTYSK